jgi:predicted RNA binding protein YcfA (HicA-like mRNA interferase family)
MNSAEFIRRARQHAKQRGLKFCYDPRRGKGSHRRLLMGNRLTTVKSGNKVIGKGLLHKMLKDLNIDPKDF